LLKKEQTITEDIEIIRYFNSWCLNREIIWLWQVNGDEQRNNEEDMEFINEINDSNGPKQRIIHYALASKVDLRKQEIWLKPAKTDSFRFDRLADLFIYIPKESFASKVSIRKFENHFLTFSVPEKMTRIPGDFFQNIHLIEQENEEKFSHLRQHPRKKAMGTQYINIQIFDKNQNGRLKDYQLYDLSQGGMAFVCEDPGECIVGETVILRTIDNKELAKKLQGTIVAIRTFDDQGFKLIKVSVKFE
jgi:hypothetical protein